MGHAVTAVDRDAQALAALADVPGIRTLQADLEGGAGWPMGEAKFSAVVVANYLHRPLFGPVRAALHDGGVLIYETFMRGNERFGKPSNPHFLLQPGELLAAFGAGMQVRAFEQGFVGIPKPAMIQRLCAIVARIG